MLILGLNHGEFNSSAVILENGKIIAGSPEERFSRKKLTKDFPINAIKFCLDNSKKQLKDCDYIAQAWNPGEYWQKFNPLISSFRSKREDYFFTIPDNLLNISERKTPKWTIMNFSDNSSLPPIYYIRHHLTHAANAFFLSPFNESAILTCDWNGEFESTTMGYGNENNIDIISNQKLPHSLGLFYATFTSLLGYRPDSDEWKVMALSAFDVDYEEVLEKIRGTIFLKENGLFELDESYYHGELSGHPKLHSQKLIKLLGGNEGKSGENPTDWHLKIAKGMQQVSEEIVMHMLNYLYKKTKSENISVSGGFFMNSVCNGKILEKSPFKKFYVSYAPSDVGNSIGAALYVSHCIHKEKRNMEQKLSYIGPSFNDSEIIQVLNRRKIKYEVIKNTEREIAKILSNNEIVSCFHGKMEFGERALGNRSILADPRNKEIKDKINSIIKYRENFRPFAPIVLFEKASIYFDVPKDFECKHMEKVVQVKQEYQDMLGAVTHVDGSGRVQTVKKEDNEFLHSIIVEFEKKTGLPILLNTSFNVNGEPIVLSPNDALNTFFNSGLEHLFLENFYVKK
jgi:carbamoyltransferase